MSSVDSHTAPSFLSSTQNNFEKVDALTKVALQALNNVMPGNHTVEEGRGIMTGWKQARTAFADSAARQLEITPPAQKDRLQAQLLATAEDMFAEYVRSVQPIAVLAAQKLEGLQSAEASLKDAKTAADNIGEFLERSRSR